jgi:signal peptidase I
MSEKQTPREKPRRRPFETTKALAVAILLALAIRSFVVEPFTIPSGSMIPTLLVGDFILVNKFVYGVRLPITGTLLVPAGEPSRGDVMVFRYPDDPSQDFIKRVIGVPGDRIEIREGRLWRNGQPADRRLVGEYVYTDVERKRAVPTRRYRESTPAGEEYTTIYRSDRGGLGGRGPWLVPEAHYFVMGDNRDNSRDSRFWRSPFVRADQIKGRAMLIHWSWVLGGSRADRGLVLGLLDTLWRVVTFQVEEVRWDRIGRRVHGVAD